MGKLNIPLPALPKAVRPEIPTPPIMPINMPVTKPKGEIETRQSVQGQHDIHMARLIRTVEGGSMTKEFDDVLTALRSSVNNNYFAYKKGLGQVNQLYEGDHGSY